MVIFRLNLRTSTCKSREKGEEGEEDVDKVEDQEVVRGCVVEAEEGGAKGADLIVEDVKETGNLYNNTFAI